MAGDPPRGAAQRAGQPESRTSESRPGRLAAGLLGEPVHDRVAAVGQHDEQHADAVVRRAPQRLDSYSDEPSPTTATTGRSGRAIRTPIAAGSANPSPPMAALRKPSGARAGSSRCSSGRLDGVSSTTTVSAGSRFGQRGEHVRRPASARRPGRAAAAARTARRPGGPDGRGRSPARRARAQTAAGSAEDGQLGRAAVRLGRVVGDQRDARARLDERPRLVGVLAEHRRADGEHDVVARERPAQPRRGRRAGGPANSGWSCGKPARAPNASCQTGRAEPLGQRDERRPGLGGRRRPRRRRAPATRAPSSRAASSSTAAGSTAARAQHPGRRGEPVARPRARPSRPSGTITSAGPRPVTASW